MNARRKWLCALGGHNYESKEHFYVVDPTLFENKVAGNLILINTYECKDCNKVKYDRTYIDKFYEINNALKEVESRNEHIKTRK